MQQTILPLIPHGATKINNILSIYRQEDRCIYFLGQYPIYSHDIKDLRMFRLVTAQLIESGACRQVDILKTFGVTKSSVIRSQNKLRNGGSEAFFKPRKRRCGGTKLTVEVLKKAQVYLDQGRTRRDISEDLKIKYDTLRKAINDGRLQESKGLAPATTKSYRNGLDAAVAEGMGTACTRVEERVLASMGKCEGVSVRFESCLDVPKGGVLCALPALLANGLFEGAKHILGKVKGYYTVFHVLLLLAFMALCRIKVVEGLRGEAPGEFGKILGLDRIPEVRCLRNKMDEMSSGDSAEHWAAHLSSYWMEMEPGGVGTLYVDGHVRVYHGGITKPPRRYVSRERLCLRGTTDYWVNDAVGLPFFVVEKPIDPGLLSTLREDIVPRLLEEIPENPTEQELDINPHLCRFILVFDREGYSPAFFSEMWQKHRIACITYHKHPDEAWPDEWFTEHKVAMPRGEVVTMSLAEMGSLVGSGKNTIWMREIRKLTDSGHQTSLISTAYEGANTKLAAYMFSRWCQENFFRYMMKHFAIDLLQEYGVEEFPATEKVINPDWRELDRLRNSIQNKLRYRRALFAEITMHPKTDDNEKKYRKWLEKKADLFEQIEQYEHQLADFKLKLKQTKRYIVWAELEEKDKFHRLLPGRKRLMDTVRMIAYRAESTMGGLLIDHSIDSATARKILQDLFVTEADIIPEPENGQLRVCVHNASRPAMNRILAHIFEKLNNTEVQYPGTDMRVHYELGAQNSQNPRKGVKQTSQR